MSRRSHAKARKREIELDSPTGVEDHFTPLEDDFFRRGELLEAPESWDDPDQADADPAALQKLKPGTLYA
jgi:hypothetical protein